jgi:iron complex transport system substrate-binding protein
LQRNIYAKLMVLFVILVVLLPGCAMQGKQAAQEGTQKSYLTIKDDVGRTVVLNKKPERVVVLSPSFLELFYAVDGKAVGRPSSKTADIPESAQALPDVGYVYNVNVEKVVSLQPDLVIAFQGIHEKLIPILESSNIPVIILKMKTYDDLIAKVRLFGDIAGTTEKAQVLIQAIDTKLKAITAKLPVQTTKVVILHATTKSVTVELENSIAGSMASMLKLQNIAAGSKPLDNDTDATPYSLEKLVEGDPDIIFVVTMGPANEIERSTQAELERNPAWSNLRAVREKKVIFLPSDLFLLNPGLRLPDAVAYMAKVVYPGIYSNGQ